MTVRLFLLLVTVLAVAVPLRAQNAVRFTIQADQVTGPISPMIYGTNVLCIHPLEAVDNTYPGIPARRFGGDRITGYNWENNFSNGGVYVCDPAHPNDPDYCNPNDDALPYFHNLPANEYRTPGAVLKAFHDRSVENGSFSLVQLPMAGYVARDGNGPVTTAESAPSNRWVAVVNRKGSPFQLLPDANDDAVYADEEINFLIATYGNASSVTGVRAYELDNEPDIWYADGNNSGTHPRLYPQPLTVDALMRKSRELAGTIRGMDPAAEIFGPAFANYAGYYNLHFAPDWDAVKGNSPRFVDYYLSEMNAVSMQTGARLLDAITLHWCSQEDGVDGDDTSPATVRRRLQAPRSLWDPTYVETSWITQFVTLGQAIRQIPDLQESIDANFPGTKIGITEWRFGAKNHISGGLATADALGIFGTYHVHFASFFDQLTGYVRSAFDLYRNFGGGSAEFGSLSLAAATDNIAATSVYASLNATRTELHIIALNKTENDIDATIDVEGAAHYQSAVSAYGLLPATPAVVPLGPAAIGADNVMTYRLPAYSAAHLVLRVSGATATDAAPQSLRMGLDQNHPNPAAALTHISFSLPAAEHATLTVNDALGRVVARLVDGELSRGVHTIDFPAAGLPRGVYTYTLRSVGGAVTRMMTLSGN